MNIDRFSLGVCIFYGGIDLILTIYFLVLAHWWAALLMGCLCVFCFLMYSYISEGMKKKDE